MEKIVLIVSHCPDPLINKRIQALKLDYAVTILYIERGNPDFTKYEDVEYIKMNATYKNGKLFRRIFDSFKLKKQVNKTIKDRKAENIYAFRLDMLMLISKQYLKKCKIVYEVADLHNAIINNSKNTFKIIIRKTLYSLEKNFCKYVDILSITSEKYYDVYFNKFIPKEKMVYMPNIPNVEYFKKYKKKKSGKFTVGFIGFVRYKEQMKMLIEAAKKIDIKVFFAGASDDDEIMNLSKQLKNIEYYGRYDYNTEIAQLYSKCDCIYSVYDTKYNNVKYALPNKLYESIYCKLPILVSSRTYLGKLVEELNVGVTVDAFSLTDLISKIGLLKDDKEFYEDLSKNCQKCKDVLNIDKYNKEFINKLKNVRKI